MNGIQAECFSLFLYYNIKPIGLLVFWSKKKDFCVAYKYLRFALLIFSKYHHCLRFIALGRCSDLEPSYCSLSRMVLSSRMDSVAAVFTSRRRKVAFMM